MTVDYRLTRDPVEAQKKNKPWNVTIIRALNPDGSLVWNHQDIRQYQATWQGGGDSLFLATWMQKADAMAGDVFYPDRYQYYVHANYKDERPSAVRPGKTVNVSAKDLLYGGEVQEILPDTQWLVSLQAHDLALKRRNIERADRDYYARASGWASRDGKLYIEDVYQARVTETEAIDDIVRAGKQSRARAIGIESVSFQFLLTQHAAKAAHLPIIELDPENRDKVLRARGLAARYNTRPTGMVFHRYDMLTLRQFEGQMTSFPNGAHDDMVDAAVYLFELAAKYAGGRYETIARDNEEMRRNATTLEHRTAEQAPLVLRGGQPPRRTG